MSTQAQIDANRTNAQRSTGPRSTDGKRRVARNAITHGLDSRAVVLPDEDAAAYTHYRAAMVADHQPVGAEEQDCVERMVACQWRIRRVWRAEADVHAQASLRLRFEADAGTALLFDLQHEKAFAALDMRETRLTRTYERASRRLQELQDLRRKGVRHGIDEEDAATEATDSFDAQSGNSAEQTQSAERPEIPAETMPPEFAADSNDRTIRESAEQSQFAEQPARAAA